MQNFYEMTIAGCKRSLPICGLNDNASIAGFVIFGDVELTCACAKALIKKAPEFDCIVVPEAKAIPLAHEFAKQTGRNDYLVVRKHSKAYMQNVYKVSLNSITTKGVQSLYMDQSDADKIRGKKILILDDVISTGESLRAVEYLVEQAGGIVAAKMFILAEGDSKNRDDIIYLEALPLFDAEGYPIL